MDPQVQETKQALMALVDFPIEQATASRLDELLDRLLELGHNPESTDTWDLLVEGSIMSVTEIRDGYAYWSHVHQENTGPSSGSPHLQTELVAITQDVERAETTHATMTDELKALQLQVEECKDAMALAMANLDKARRRLEDHEKKMADQEVALQNLSALRDRTMVRLETDQKRQQQKRQFAASNAFHKLDMLKQSWKEVQDFAANYDRL